MHDVLISPYVCPAFCFALIQILVHRSPSIFVSFHFFFFFFWPVYCMKIALVTDGFATDFFSPILLLTPCILERPLE